jgi:hypothetical protein
LLRRVIHGQEGLDPEVAEGQIEGGTEGRDERVQAEAEPAAAQDDGNDRECGLERVVAWREQVGNTG